MNPKILVADDSPTIQKVVSITLAGSDYLLETALDEGELFKKLASDTFDLVLLDFNISEEHSGYELTKKIREISNSTKVLVMLGTFDSIDDHSLNESGVIDQIVKPFESSLFIDKVKGALDGKSPEASETVNLESNESEWVMDNASVEEIEVESSDLVEDHQDSQIEEENPLNEVISGWGMSVPSVIGIEENVVSLPPKFNDSKDETALEDGASLIQEITENENYEEITEEVLMPEEDDLDYPDLQQEETKEIDLSSKLVSLDELEPEEDEIDLASESDDTHPHFVIGSNEDSPDLISSVEEDVSPDEFWAADQTAEEDAIDDNETGLYELGEDELKIEQHTPIDIEAETAEVSSPVIEALNSLGNAGPALGMINSSEVGPKLEKLSTNDEVGPKLERVSFDYDELIDRLKKDLRPMISEIVQEAVEAGNSKAVEKVAWEIIPDLAENLIRKEVENLSKKVQDKHSLS